MIWFYERSMDLLVYKDPDGSILAWPMRMLTLLGYSSPVTLIGCGLPEIKLQ